MRFDIIEQMCSTRAGTIKKESVLTYDISREKRSRNYFLSLRENGVREFSSAGPQAGAHLICTSNFLY